MRTLEVEGMGTQARLPLPQEAAWALAAPHRSHDLAASVAHHVARAVVGPIGRGDARRISFREGDELRVTAATHVQTQKAQTDPTRTSITIGMTKAKPIGKVRETIPRQHDAGPVVVRDERNTITRPPS